jgi:hypothetical protein
MIPWHEREAPATQVPVPLQREASVTVPAEQRAAAQTVPDAYRRQPPMPLHVPSVPQLAAPWF